MEQHIAELVTTMRKYQQTCKIEKQCLANVQYLYDTIRMNFNVNVKAKAVMVYSYDSKLNQTKIIIGHLVVLIEDSFIIDPSFDVFNLKNIKYFDNLNTFINSYNIKNNYDVKTIIEEHLVFQELATRMNKNEIIISNKKYYNNIADFIAKTHKSKYIIER